MTKMQAGAIRGAVLDLETVIDEDAAAWSGNPGPGERAALRRIVCASVLRFVLTPDHGELTDLDLRTFNCDLHAEAEIVGFVDRALPDPSSPSSLLLTWNGRAYDMRVLRHRACASWMFAVPHLRGWCSPRPAGRHLDMMVDANAGLGRGRWWSLRDACAGLSVSLRPTRGRNVTQSYLAGDHEAVALRNRRDVAGTLLCFAYWESFRRGCPLPAASAWCAMGKLTGIDPARDDGTASLTHHHLVEAGLAHYYKGVTSGTCGCANATPVTTSMNGTPQSPST